MSERTIAEWQEAMAGGEITAVGLVRHYLQRIEQLDRGGPRLNSVLELNPQAEAIAAALDDERALRGPRGSLHGMPILIKGNIDTADQMTTTAGSLALEGHIAVQDAFLVSRLRRAGAIILGKTNLSEWANFRSTRSVSGWSSQGGQTLNPYALDRNPCGSSSGSGAAAAADLCAAAVGTETDGSIVCPASASGIVGIKPTVGLVSRSGIIPISHSQDTAGPMARTVADAAILLQAMAAPDANDKAELSYREPGSYLQALQGGDLRGTRIGVARNFENFGPRVEALFEQSIQALRDLGTTIIDEANIETAGQIGEHEIEVLTYEFKAGLNDYLSGLDASAKVHSLAELIAFNEAHIETTMPYFGQERLLITQEKGPLSDPEYREALSACRRLARDQGIDAVLAAHQLDALIAPTRSPAWLIDWVNGDCAEGSSSGPAAVAGYPSVCVPMGLIFGLPVNISFIGGAWQEAKLIRLAYAFEQATKARRPPQFRPTVVFG